MPKSASLLIYHVDDDPTVLTLCEGLLARHWPDTDTTLEVLCFCTPRDMLTAAATRAPDMVLFDFRLGEAGTAPAYIPELRRLAPSTAIIVLSELLSSDATKQALAAEADDFVTRCGDPVELTTIIHAAYRLAQRRRHGSDVNATTTPACSGSTLAEVAQRVPNLVASALSCVHIYGESGTGKEVVADLFRQQTCGTPFVTVNCAALPPTLAEAELFGAVRGAYTGAVNDRRGLFEAAQRGWLFLDEVACLPPNAQAALLRAIENQEIVRVGDNRVIKINVRILSATNENLEGLVETGRFRRDLWQRLCEATITLPPLAARRAEIPALIDYLAGRLPGGPFQVTAAAKKLLSELDWRAGNVRELRNCLKAMTELHEGRILGVQAIPRAYVMDKRTVVGSDRERPVWQHLAFAAEIKRLQSAYGRQSVRQLAGHLGMSKSAVARRLKAITDSRL